MVMLLLLFSRKLVALQKRIDDPHAIDDLAVLHIFGEDYATTRLPGTMKHQSIPVGDPVQPMEVDCRENIRRDWLNNVKPAIGLDLLPSQSRIETELPRGVHKIFL